MKIMVVDDEKNMKRLFEQRVRKECKSGLVEFQFAFSAREALDILEKEPEVIVLVVSAWGDSREPLPEGRELGTWIADVLELPPIDTANAPG